MTGNGIKLIAIFQASETINPSNHKFGAGSSTENNLLLIFPLIACQGGGSVRRGGVAAQKRALGAGGLQQPLPRPRSAPTAQRGRLGRRGPVPAPAPRHRLSSRR